MESLSWLRCVLYDQWQNIVTLYFHFSLFAKHESFVETLPVSLWGRV